MNIIKRVFIFLFMLVSFFQLANAKSLYELNFKDATGDVEAWFKERGWVFKEGMEDIHTFFKEGVLYIEPKEENAGLIYKRINTSDPLAQATYMDVIWGVNQYPKGSNWEGAITEKRKTRNAVSFMIFFGNEKISSGSLVVPNVPRFISLFLDKADPKKVYYGNYWQKGGRYLCYDCDGKTGEKKSRFPITKTFSTFFSIKPLPISALVIEVDVGQTKQINGYYSKAFIKSIRFE